MRDPEILLMEMRNEGRPDARQIEATLILAHQVKRIADVLAGISSIVNDVESGETWRVIAITDVSRGKTTVENPPNE